MVVSESGLPHILIVDRDAAARRRLRSQLRSLGRTLPVHAVTEAGDGAAARLRVDRGDIHIVLLDVMLADCSAIDLAHSLRESAAPPQVILIAPFAEVGVPAPTPELADCLLRPVRTERLALALSRALSRLGAAPRSQAGPRLPAAAPLPARPAPGAARRADFIPVLDRGAVLAVPIGDVLYLRAELKYVTIRTRDRAFLTQESLDGLARAFPDRFVRIHRHTLVARDAIAAAVPAGAGDSPAADACRALRLHGVPEQLPVSRRQWASLRGLLAGLADSSTMAPEGGACQP